jgi:hypothetical protein
MKKYDMLKAHQNVLVALCHLAAVCQKQEVPDSYIEDINSMIRAFQRRVSAVMKAKSDPFDC